MPDEVDPETGHALLMTAVDSIGVGTTLAQALVSLVGVLRAPLELWHANVMMLEEGAPTARVLASWSVTESAFAPGIEVATSISPAVEEAVATVRRGEVVLVDLQGQTDSLVDHLMRKQGVASVLGLPVYRDSRETLVLTLGSSSGDALRSVKPSFYRGLAAGIGERVAQLARARSS